MIFFSILGKLVRIENYFFSPWWTNVLTMKCCVCVCRKIRSCVCFNPSTNSCSFILSFLCLCGYVWNMINSRIWFFCVLSFKSLLLLSLFFFVFFPVTGSAGLGFLQFCNLNSFRTKLILGFSIFMGFSVPQYFNEYTAFKNYGPVHTHARWVFSFSHSITFFEE